MYIKNNLLGKFYLYLWKFFINCKCIKADECNHSSSNLVLSPVVKAYMPQFGILFKIIWGFINLIINFIITGRVCLIKKENHMKVTEKLVKQIGNKTKCERQVGNYVIDLIGLIA